MTLSPFNAFQLIQGLETLSIRVQKHSSNALKIAEFLQNHPKVKSVNYPGLRSSPNYDFVSKNFKNGLANGLLSFEVENYEFAKKVLNSTKIFAVVVNIGDSKSFNKGKRDSETKLQSKTAELGNNKASLKGMTEDYGKFMGKAKKDKDGNILNLITLDGVESTNLEVIGKHLQRLAEKETTGGQYKRIGEIYGFPVKIVSETSFENGLPFVDNRFFVEGNYKYQYNYGHIAKSDPIAAANNFLNALQKIPSYIEQYDSRCKALEKEIQQLEEIAGKTWKKEEELKGLKAELAALDRKIQLELAPPVPEKDISDKSQKENNTIKSGEFYADTIVQQERKVRIGL